MVLGGLRVAVSMRLLLIAVICCSGCSACPSGERVAQGPYPYTRCRSLSAPPDGVTQVKDVQLVVEGRVLQLHGPRAVWNIAAFAGPAPGRWTGELGALQSHSVDLVLVMGGLGDDPQTVGQSIGSLSRLPFPSLVLPGGRDRLPWLVASHDALPQPQRSRVQLLTGIQRVRMGDHEFIVVPGVEGGRYGLDRDVCGFAPDELAAFARALASPSDGVTRWLWSWSAPGEGGALAVARTHAGVDVGSGTLATFAQRVGARGGIFAWPAVRALEPVRANGQRPVGWGESADDVRVTVPRLGGPALERSDGSRVPSGFALLQIDGPNVRLLPPVAAAGGGS